MILCSVILEFPTCSKVLHYSGNINPNALLEHHFTKECTQKKDENKFTKNGNRKKMVCAAEKCIKQINTVSMYTCKKCKKNLCLTHRIPELHSCGMPVKKMAEKRCADEVIDATVNFNVYKMMPTIIY